MTGNENASNPAPGADTLLPLRRRGDRPPLFCIHPGGGFAVPYNGLMRSIDTTVPVYGVQARGLLTPAPLPDSIEEMARDYVSQIRRIQPAGPYRLLGWCFGGRVAYEMACQLRDAGHAVDLLVLLDAYAPEGDEPPDPQAMLISLVLPPEEDTVDEELIAACLLPLNYQRVHAYLAKTQHYLMNLDEEMFRAVYQVYCNTERLHRSPIARRFDGDAVCIAAISAADQDTVTIDGWHDYVTGKIESHVLDCRHGEVMDAGPLVEIGAIVNGSLARVSP
jgi:thioesterase domain-containing protein